MPNDTPLVKTPTIIPPGPETGFQNQKCYLRITKNCSEKISGEHLVSASILSQLPGGIKMSGFPGQEKGAFKRVGINSLTSNVLCTRHNSALAPLDTAAGHFFAKMSNAMKYADTNSMVRKTKYYLVNGDALERWALKTMLGLFYSKVASANGTSIFKSHTLNDPHATALLGNEMLPSPLGLYITLGQTNHIGMQIALAPLLHLETQTLCGVTIQFPGMTFGFIFDASKSNNDFFVGTSVYRPGLLEIEGGKRSSRLFMTWPGQGLTGYSVKSKLSKHRIGSAA